MRTLKEFIAEKLVNTEIFEMAQSISDFESNIESQFSNIMSHIIFIMKARKDNDLQDINHWKSEIKTFLTNCIKKRLKIKKDNYESRYKHIYNKLINEIEIDTDDDYIIADIWADCYKEGYDLDDRKVYNEFLDLIHEFQENYLYKIIDVIASKNIHKVQNFVNEL